MKLLVAEDDLTSRSILVNLLQHWGYQPVVVDNGDSAWDIMQQPDAPMLALLDWEMPGLDGIEVCQRIRSLDNENPPYLVILTVKGETTSIVRGLDSGANDYITKPYHNDELLARLRTGERMLKLQTELVTAKQELAYEASHDALTGALNRRGILSRLASEITRARRNRRPLFIGLCDIDHFKKINDRYGHQAGDRVLQIFIAVLQKQLREYDLLGRFGGEEFLIVAPESTAACIENLYERLRHEIELLRFPTIDENLQVTVSIGVAETHGNVTIDNVLAEADAALYRAKRSGRNKVVVTLVGIEKGQTDHPSACPDSGQQSGSTGGDVSLQA